MRRPRLILHIGVTRTGSTALQRFFAGNRAMLPAFGLSYPRGRDEAGRPATHHGALTAALAGAEARGAPEDVLARMLAGAERRRATLISAEGLAERGAAAADLFGPLGARFDVSAVVYLRRQDEWALSAWRAAVVDPGIREARAFADWLADPATQARMDYRALLGAWAGALGTRAVRVLRYPHDAPILPAFLRAAGLSSGLLALPFQRRRVRESVPDAILQACLERNGGVAAVPHFTMAERDALFERFREGNREVRERYRPELPRLFTAL